MKSPKHAIFVRYGKFEALVVGAIPVGLVVAVVASLLTQPSLWAKLVGH